MSAWSIASAGLGAIGSLIGGKLTDKYNAKAQERQYQYQRKLNAEANEMNRQNLQDYASLNVQGYRKAGLNLAALQGGTNLAAAPSADSGAAPSAMPSAFGEGVSKAAQSVAQAIQLDSMQANAELARAGAKKAEAEAEGKTIENSNKQTEYDLTFEKWRSDISYTSQKIGESQATIDNMRNIYQLNKSRFDMDMKESASRIGLNERQANLFVQQADYVARQIFWYDRKAQADLREICSRIGLNSAQASYLNQQTIAQELANWYTQSEKDTIEKWYPGFFNRQVDLKDTKNDVERILLDLGVPPAEAKSAVESKVWIQYADKISTIIGRIVTAGATVYGASRLMPHR